MGLSFERLSFEQGQDFKGQSLKRQSCAAWIWGTGGGVGGDIEGQAVDFNMPRPVDFNRSFNKSWCFNKPAPGTKHVKILMAP